MTPSVKEAAAGVWRAFASRDPETIRAVLTDDAAWIAPERNATQVALGLAADMLETPDASSPFWSIISAGCFRTARSSNSRK